MKLYSPFLEYANRQEFYADRGGRWSPERDYGVHHTDGVSRLQRYRISVVADTGDIYAEQQYHPQRILVLGQLPGADDPLQRTAEAIPAVYPLADRIFAGYVGNDNGPGRTLAWFAARLRESARDDATD